MILRKLKNLTQLKTSILKLLPEVLIYLVCSKLLLKLVPFTKLQAYIGTLNHETSYDIAKDKVRLNTISSAISIIARNMPIEIACYPQAIAGKLMLKRRGIESTLYIGMKKEKNKQLEGHAWLRSGNTIITGGSNNQQYKTIATYA